MALLEYSFKVVGMDAVKSAFGSVERWAAEHDRRMKSRYDPSARRGGRGMTGGGGGAGSAAGGASRSASTRAAVNADKAAAKERAAADRAAAKASVAAERAASRERQQIRAAERRAEAAASRMAARNAVDELRHHKRMKAKAEQAAVAGNMRRERLARSISMGAQRVGNTVGALATGAAGLVGIGGSAMFVNAVGQVMGDSKSATDVANIGADSGTSLADRRANKAKILKAARGVKGFKTDDVIKGIGGYVDKTGRLDEGIGILGEVGELAQATGTDFGVMMAAAGAMSNDLDNNGIKGPEAKDRLLTMLRTMAGQANKGSVGMADVAQYGSRFVAASSKFAGDPGNVMSAIGAMTQNAVMRGGASDAAEGATSVTRFADDLVKNQEKAKKLGIDVFSDKSKTKLRDPRKIIADILEKTGGDLTKIDPIFGAEGQKVIQGYSGIYNEAEKRKKGSGRAAVAANFEMFDKAALTAEDQKNGAALAREDAQAKYTDAMNEFNAAVGDKLLPAVTKLIDPLSKLAGPAAVAAEALANLANYAADNPFPAIGVVLAAALTKEIASAGLGAALNAALNKSMTVGAGASILGAAGAAAAVAAGAAIAAPFIGAALINYQEEVGSVERGGIKAQEDNNTAANSITDLLYNKRRGTSSAKDDYDLEAIRREQGRQVALGKDEEFKRSMDLLGTNQAIANVMHTAGNWAGYTDSEMTAVGLKNSDEVEREIQRGAGAKQNLDRINGAVKVEGGEELKTAAAALTTAASVLSNVQGGLNRGNTPSPVKN